MGAVNGYIEEMIEGQKVIKVFNHEQAAKTGSAALTRPTVRRHPGPRPTAAP